MKGVTSMICEKGKEVLPFPEPKVIYLSENNLAKTRAFAEILATDDTVLTSDKRLQEICKELNNIKFGFFCII